MNRELPPRKDYETDREFIGRLNREHSFCFNEARQAVRKDNLLNSIARAESLEDIKRVLVRIVEEV